MSFITFQCYACGKGLKVPDDKAGRKAKCNQCGTVLTIPAQSNVPEAPSQAPPPSHPFTTPFPQQMQSSPAAPGPTLEPAFADFAPQPVPDTRTPQPGPAFGAPPPGGYPPHPASGGYPQQPFPGAYAAPMQHGAGSFSQYPNVQDQPCMPEPAGPGGPPKWSMVRLGLLLVFIGTCVMAGAYALLFIGYLLVTIPMVQSLSGYIGTASPDTPRIILAIGSLISLLGTLAAIAGYVFCILGPNKRGSFGLAIAVAAVAVLESLLIMIFQLPALFSSRGPGATGSDSFMVSWIMFLLIQLLFGAEIVLFPLVIRAFCLGLTKRQSARAATMPIILASSYTGIRVLTLIFWLIAVNSVTSSATTFRVMGWTTIILLWAGIITFVIFLIVYTLYLWRMRGVLPAK